MSPTTPRWDALATQVADGTRVGPGSRVSITMTGLPAHPAVTAFVQEVHRRGGQPQVVLADAAYDSSALRSASEAVLEEPSPLELLALQWSDVHVAFRAMTVPEEGEPELDRLVSLRRAKGKVSTARWNQKDWAIVRIPTPQWADLVGLDHERVQEEFFSGCLADWATLRPRWEALAADLERCGTVVIRSADTDLTLDVTGRRWVVFAGEANLPDGELATAPVDDSAQGHITFPGPFWFADSRFDDLRLTFEAGRVVDVQASTGAALARELIATDEGACRIGELGIGLNAGVVTPTGDLFLDEKILGTVHLALGRAYPQCGGVNQSSLHWDIVKDLRGHAPGGPGDLHCGPHRLVDAGVISEQLACGQPLPHPTDRSEREHHA